MKLALVSPLPPLASPAADLVARVLPHLRAHAQIRLLPHAPEQVDGSFAAADPVDPLADLPRLLACGAVDVPIYFLCDDLVHAHQLRYVREHPGVLVLLSHGVHRIVAALTEESGDLDAYRDHLIEVHGEVARDWPERFVWHADRERVRARLPLTGLVTGRSHIVLAEPRVAARLRQRGAGSWVEDLPPHDDVAALAARLLGAALSARDEPRTLAPLLERKWPRVEVVLVSYNSKSIIGPALESIAAQDYPSLTCTMIDNDSSDGTADFVRENYPFVEVIDAGGNLGFAGGNNRAFARTQAEYVVLFNQDAVARADFVRELVRVAERDPSVGAVGAKMLMRRCPTIFNSTGIDMNEAGFAVDRQIGEKDDDPSPVPVRVFGACGGAKLIRTATIRELGGFDEKFFMYFEDVDLCWRMRLAGYQVLYAPLAVVHHDWHGDLDAEPAAGATSHADEVNAKTHRRRFLCERNRLQCLFKNYEIASLRRVLRELRRFDKVRLGWVRDSIRSGHDVGYFTVVGKAIRGAWRYVIWNLPGLWRRRRAVQRLRTVPDAEIAELIAPGVHEPAHVGDLESIQDRFSAEATEHLVMGVNDGRALGAGWYPIERVADQPWDLRWCMGRAWFYLTVNAPAARLCLRVSKGSIETALHVVVGLVDLGSQPVVDHEMHVLEYELPAPLPATDLVEVRLSCRTFRPSAAGGDDHRQLGVRVAEVWWGA